MTTIPLPTAVPAVRPSFRPSFGRGLVELGLVAVLYVAYSASRLLASDDLGAATDRARGLLALERHLGLAWEGTLNRWFSEVPALGIAASYHYATAHYVVTLVVVVWLYRRGGAAYPPARNALIGATVLGLVGYLMLPTAPPRLAGLGHTDVLRQYAAAGWWGGSASAPRGLGEYTNELAAMPSLHAGWALWVLLAVTLAGAGRWWRLLALLHVLVTAAVVVGTGNHWVLDVLAGWAVVGAAWWACAGGVSARPGSGSDRRGTPARA